MKDKLMLLIICLIAIPLLAGCRGESGSSSFFGGGDDSVVANVPYDGGSGDSGGDDPGGGGDDPGGGLIQPEPATLGLLGSGLLAYALLRRKKKK